GFQYYRDGVSPRYDLQAELRTNVLNVFFSQQFGFSQSLPPTGIGLDALSYKGLANGNVRLGDLASEAGFGSVADLLDAELTAGELLRAEANALKDSGNSSDVAAGNKIASFYNKASSTNHMRLGDFIDISQGGKNDAADYTINALSLMQGAGQFMDG